MNLLYNYFEGFKDIMVGREAEMRGSMVKYVERQLEGGGGVCEISVRLPKNNGTMEIMEYMCVDRWCMLDWIIGLCHKTAEIHFSGMSCSSGEYMK